MTGLLVAATLEEKRDKDVGGKKLSESSAYLLVKYIHRKQHKLDYAIQ